jgi:hypothetical protein
MSSFRLLEFGKFRSRSTRSGRCARNAVSASGVDVVSWTEISNIDERRRRKPTNHEVVVDDQHLHVAEVFRAFELFLASSIV